MNLTFNNGIEIEGLDFHLDARRKADFSFVSHAHSDHVAPHKKILATPETILFFKQRHQRPLCRALQFGQKAVLGDFEVELFPAGHILGGAQIRLEYRGRTIVYTGDFKLRPSATSIPAEILKADILIMESTYGQKKYIFPPRDRVLDQLISFVQKTLLAGQTPVILAYPLGKAQEAIKELGDFGFQVAAEDNIIKYCRLYERCGVSFKNLSPFGEGDSRGHVLVFPPYAGKNRSALRNIPGKKTCFLSGWALDSSGRNHSGADIALPLSDHADYPDLVRYVEQAQARKIFTLHGFPEFADELRRMGYDAEHLEPGRIVSLEPERGPVKKKIGNLDLFQN